MKLMIAGAILMFALAASSSSAQQDLRYPVSPIYNDQGEQLGYWMHLRCKGSDFRIQIADENTWANIFALIYGVITPEQFMEQQSLGRVKFLKEQARRLSTRCYNLGLERIAGLTVEAYGFH